MGKKTTSAAPKATETPRRPARSVFRRTSTEGRPGLGFFTGTFRSLHKRCGMNVGKTASVIIATAVQHGIQKAIERILTTRAVRGTSDVILTAEELADALRDSHASGELMYLPVVPNSTVRQIIDAEHEGVLISRTKKAEIATLKREKARKAKADAETAVGAVPKKKKARKVVTTATE
jgi:hypothetical protein